MHGLLLSVSQVFKTLFLLYTNLEPDNLRETLRTMFARRHFGFPEMDFYEDPREKSNGNQTKAAELLGDLPGDGLESYAALQYSVSGRKPAGTVNESGRGRAACHTGSTRKLHSIA
jgi:hypothetical protein